MYCKICGNILQGQEAYCPVCGAMIENSQPGSYPKFQPDDSVWKPNEYMESQEEVRKKPFLRTVAGKLTVGIVAVILVAGIVTGFLVYQRVRDGKQTEKQTTKETTEADTVSEAASADETTEATAEATAEATTSEATTETLQADSSYKEAYKSVLEENEVAINAYTWQYAYGGSEAPTPIVFWDITGDGIPEMITIQAPYGTESSSADLMIYTVENGTAQQLYTTTGDGYSCWDVEAAAGTTFYLFTLKGETGLYAYNGIGDEGYEDTYIQFGFDDSGEFGKVHTWLRASWPNEDYTDMDVACQKDEKEISEEQFNKRVEKLESNIDIMLMYEGQAKETVQRITGSLECEAMTFEDALTYVNSSDDGQNAGTAEDVVGKLPDGMPSGFWFSSGVGAWVSEITLNQDGTFDGDYHDSDMGDSGDDYPNGTVYISSVTGNFKNIQKLDRYTYQMELDTCNLARTSGEEWIEDGIRYVASDFYGISGGTEFYLYLPGTLTSNLPEYVASWPMMFDYYVADGALTCYILYSEEAGGVFVGPLDDVD